MYPDPTLTETIVPTDYVRMKNINPLPTDPNPVMRHQYLNHLNRTSGPPLWALKPEM